MLLACTAVLFLDVKGAATFGTMVEGCCLRSGPKEDDNAKWMFDYTDSHLQVGILLLRYLFTFFKFSIVQQIEGSA
jgi:hypothetical protein